MAQEHVSIIIKAKDLSEAVFKKVEGALKSVGNVAKAFAKALAAVTAAATAAVVGLAKLSQRGTEYVNVQRAFNRATGDQGVKALKYLRDETQGLISNYELMSGLNKAVTLGSAENAEQFAELANTAIKLGRALGVDAAYALESLNTGIARQSRLFLDNIGIVMSVEQANKQYAESIGKTVKQLTDAEKREAFRAGALEAARVAVERLGGSQETAGDSVQRLVNGFANMRDRLAEIITSSPGVSEFFNTLARLVDQITPKLERIASGVGDLARTMGHFIVGAAGAVGLIDPVYEETRARLEKLNANAALLTRYENELRTAILNITVEWFKQKLILDEIVKSGNVLSTQFQEQAGIVGELEAQLNHLASEYKAVKDAQKGLILAGPPTAPGAGIHFAPQPISRGIPSFGGGVATDIIRGELDRMDAIRRGKEYQRRYLEGLEAERRAKEAARLKSIDMANTVIGAFAAMAAAAAQGSRGLLGSIIGGAAAIAAVAIPGIGPVTSTAILAGGGVLSSAVSGIGRGPTPVLVQGYSPTALQQQKQVIGPSRFTFQFLNARGELTQEEILYMTRYLEDIDAVVRIPGTRLGAP